MAISQDETLKGNEKIEEAILGLQKETSQEMLAHVLTVIRRRMNENGQVIVAVEMNPGNTQMAVKSVRTEDGKCWSMRSPSFKIGFVITFIVAKNSSQRNCCE